MRGEKTDILVNLFIIYFGISDEDKIAWPGRELINTVFVIQKYVYKIIHCIRLINNQRLVYFIKYLRCYARSDWLIRLKNLCLQCTSKSINPAEVPALRAWTREPRTITITNCNKQSWFWLAEISIPFHSTCTLKFSRKNRTRSFPAYEAFPRQTFNADSCYVCFKSYFPRFPVCGQRSQLCVINQFGLSKNREKNSFDLPLSLSKFWV